MELERILGTDTGKEAFHKSGNTASCLEQNEKRWFNCNK